MKTDYHRAFAKACQVALGSDFQLQTGRAKIFDLKEAKLQIQDRILNITCKVYVTVNSIRYNAYYIRGLCTS